MKRLKLSPKKYVKLKQYVFYRDTCSCVICGLPHHLTPHHVINRAQGGADAPNNLVTLCVACHDKVEQRKIDLPESVKETLASEPLTL